MQVGSAIGNINGLEPGGTWKFKATSLGVGFVKYKFSELSGFEVAPLPAVGPARLVRPECTLPPDLSDARGGR